MGKEALVRAILADGEVDQDEAENLVLFEMLLGE